MSTDAGLGRSLLSEETSMGADIIGKLTGSVLLFLHVVLLLCMLERGSEQRERWNEGQNYDVQGL